MTSFGVELDQREEGDNQMSWQVVGDGGELGRGGSGGLFSEPSASS